LTTEEEAWLDAQLDDMQENNEEIAHSERYPEDYLRQFLPPEAHGTNWISSIVVSSDGIILILNPD